jgi:hypothetical protein
MKNIGDAERRPFGGAQSAMTGIVAAGVVVSDRLRRLARAAPGHETATSPQGHRRIRYNRDNDTLFDRAR